MPIVDQEDTTRLRARHVSRGWWFRYRLYFSERRELTKAVPIQKKSPATVASILTGKTGPMRVFPRIFPKTPKPAGLNKLRQVKQTHARLQ